MQIISLGLSFGMKVVTIIPTRPETRLTDICNKYKNISGNFYNYLNSFFFNTEPGENGEWSKIWDAQKLECLCHSTVRSISFEQKK